MKALVQSLVFAITITATSLAMPQNNEALYRQKSAQILQAIEQGSIKASTGFLEIAALARTYAFAQEYFVTQGDVAEARGVCFRGAPTLSARGGRLRRLRLCDEISKPSVLLTADSKVSPRPW